MTDTTDLVRRLRRMLDDFRDERNNNFWLDEQALESAADAIERLPTAAEPLAWAVIGILGDGPALNTTHRKEEADSWREHGGNVIPLYVHPAVPAPDRVPVPQNANQAAGMVLVGTAWLQENAPERLRESGPAAPTPRDLLGWASHLMSSHMEPHPEHVDEVNRCIDALDAACHPAVPAEPVCMIAPVKQEDGDLPFAVVDPHLPKKQLEAIGAFRVYKLHPAAPAPDKEQK